MQKNQNNYYYVHIIIGQKMFNYDVYILQKKNESKIEYQNLI